MKKLAICLSFLLTSGCAHLKSTDYVDVGLGYNYRSDRGGFEGGRDLFKLAIGREWGNGVYLEYQHISHPSTGEEYLGLGNEDIPEDKIDAVFTGYRYTY